MVMLDRLPAWGRHLVLMLGASGLAWAGTDLVPLLREQGGAWAAIGAPLVLLAINAGTSLTRQYGAGSGGGAVLPSDSVGGWPQPPRPPA